MTDTSVALLEEPLSAEVVYLVPGGVDRMLADIRERVALVPTDISTKAGRAAVASLAHKIARSKTALDDVGKALVAEWKAKAATVDAGRKRVRDELDKLKDDVRRPLTEWEDADKRRIEEHERELAAIMALAAFSGVVDPSSEMVSKRIAALDARAPRQWHEFAERAKAALTDARLHLGRTLEAALAREAEREELARLKAEAEARAQQERDEAIKREAAEKARIAAEAEAKHREEALIAALEAERKLRTERETAEIKAALAIANPREPGAKEDDASTGTAASSFLRAAIEQERRRIAEAVPAAVMAGAIEEEGRRGVLAEIAEDLRAEVPLALSASHAKHLAEAIVDGRIRHVRIDYDV